MSRQPTPISTRFLTLLLKLNVEIIQIFSDDNFTYNDVILCVILHTGREILRIERKQLTFRTRLKRLVRKTICYSKSWNMHTTGLIINILNFGRKTF
ncbi:MAG: IS1 family transposase [Candidatus Bathyarchaeota archaeon]|nr:IS1 family transposase [Candidatus Termiticorpusculum sp.]